MFQRRDNWPRFKIPMQQHHSTCSIVLLERGWHRCVKEVITTASPSISFLSTTSRKCLYHHRNFRSFSFWFHLYSLSSASLKALMSSPSPTFFQDHLRHRHRLITALRRIRQRQLNQSHPHLSLSPTQERPTSQYLRAIAATYPSPHSAYYPSQTLLQFLDAMLKTPTLTPRPTDSFLSAAKTRSVPLRGPPTAPAFLSFADATSSLSVSGLAVVILACWIPTSNWMDSTCRSRFLRPRQGKVKRIARRTWQLQWFSLLCVLAAAFVQMMGAGVDNKTQLAVHASWLGMSNALGIWLT